jgi:hypothetical protein
MQERLRGYVVGADWPNGRSGRKIWKVRVKDENSEYNGEKFPVAEGHERRFFAKGLDVTFLSGTFQERDGQAVRKAIDVRLFTEKENREESPKKARTVDDSEPLNIVVTIVGKEINVHFTQEAEEDIKNFYPAPGLTDDEQEELVCIVPFNIYDWTQLSSGEGIIEGFTAIRSLMLLMTIQETIEAILTATVRAFAENANS